MTKTDKNLNTLKKLTAELRTICDKKEILEKSIVDFLHNLDITTDFVKKLTEQVTKLVPYQAERLAKELIGIHFPEVSKMWEDGREYPF